MRSSEAVTHDDVPQIAAALLDRLRSRGPRVHCITNAVAQNFTANVLLSLGCLPSMTLSPEEIGPFVARSNALLVNLGTFDRERRQATDIAVTTASKESVPWVVDPVFIDRSATRARFARDLVARGPAVVRLNRAEFSALAGGEPAGAAVAAFARARKVVVGLSGETDLVSDGERLATIANGHPLMAKVTAMGCAASALVAACLAVEPDAWRATAAALTMISVAGELAAAEARGPGSFAAGIIDALYNLDGPALIANARVYMMDVDLRLYALIDPAVAGGRSLGDLASLIAGSATLVQLRDKHGSTRAMVEEARELTVVLAPLDIPLLINDRVDVALAAEADGVHIGQDDMSPADARLLLGRTAIIGQSIKTAQQAEEAALEYLDYVAIGGVYGTTSKDNTSAPIGIDGLRTIVQIIRARAPNFPICAIAGINEGNAADVIAAGADGVAVISALSLAADPASAAQNLRAVVEGALARRGKS